MACDFNHAFTPADRFTILGIIQDNSYRPLSDVANDCCAFVNVTPQAKKLLEFVFIPLVKGPAKYLLVNTGALNIPIFLHIAAVKIAYHLQAFAPVFLCLGNEIAQLPAVFHADRHDSGGKGPTGFAQAGDTARKPEGCLEDLAIALIERIHDGQQRALGAGSILAFILVTELVGFLYGFGSAFLFHEFTCLRLRRGSIVHVMIDF
jgi:hypothetical protein